MKTSLSLILFFTLFANHSMAASSHQHGKSQMTVVLEDKTLNISIQLAAYDVVGFEGQTTNENEAQSIDESMQLLNSTNKWLKLLGGACTQSAASINNPFSVVETMHDHDKVQTTHQDFQVDIDFTCLEPDKLTGLKVSLQTLFSNIHEIEMQWIVDGKQGFSVIKPSKNEVNFNHE